MTSTLDLFGRHFVLLAGVDGNAWCEAALEVSSRAGIVIDAHRIGARLSDSDGTWARAYGVSPSGAVVVRPDGFVGWRAQSCLPGGTGACAAALAQAMDVLLCRTA